MRRAPVRHWVILSAAAAFCGRIAACASSTHAAAKRVVPPHALHWTVSRAALDSLGSARARWDSAHVTAYRYRLAERSFSGAPPPVTIEVRAGQITHVQDTMG